MNNIKFYDRLGISKDASQDKIKKAYRKIPKKYRPDINLPFIHISEPTR